MNEEAVNQTFDTIHDIALNAQNKCEEPIPGIIKAALAAIASLARHKGMADLASDERERFGLPEEND